MTVRLVALLLALSPLTAQAADVVVRVPFASVAALTDRHGQRLDPSLFRFGGKPGANELIAHASTNALGKPKAEACRWALLSAFLKLQARAEQQGGRVVGVRTFAGASQSADPGACLCLAGAVVVRTVVRGTLH